MALYLSNASAKQHFNALFVNREAIERELGFPLEWQELPDSKACRIATWFPNASLEDESRWNEYQEWIKQRLVRMDQVLRPIVKTLP